MNCNTTHYRANSSSVPGDPTNPQVGLLFIDYERGDLLQIGARAVVIEGGDEVRRFEGAQRLLRIGVERSVFSPGALPLRWSAPQPAAQLAATGVWAGAPAAVG